MLNRSSGSAVQPGNCATTPTWKHVLWCNQRDLPDRCIRYQDVGQRGADYKVQAILSACNQRSGVKASLSATGEGSTAQAVLSPQSGNTMNSYLLVSHWRGLCSTGLPVGHSGSSRAVAPLLATVGNSRVLGCDVGFLAQAALQTCRMNTSWQATQLVCRGST